MDTYTYVNGNPTNLSDPDGHAAKDPFANCTPQEAAMMVCTTAAQRQQAAKQAAFCWGGMWTCGFPKTAANVRFMNAWNKANAVYDQQEAAREAQMAAQANKSWFQKAGDWIDNHATDIAAVATDIVVTAGCTVATGGAGVVGCAVLGGAAGGFVSGVMTCNGDAGCIAEQSAIGGGSALLGAGIGALGSRLVSKTLSHFASTGAGDAPILFGQRSVSRFFTESSETNPFPYAGQSVGSVASGLKNGVISADELPIKFVVRDGTRIAINNRSLLALTRAELSPTVTEDVTGDARAELDITRRLGEMGGQPSTTIRVRGGAPMTSYLDLLE